VSTAHIFLSPHLDDAVFSCGGTIAALVAAGEAVSVVTMTTASPRLDRLPESARELHSLWGLPDDVVAARRGEDRAAADLLGFVPIHLEFLDAIYRTDRRGRFLYPTRDSLFPKDRWRREGELVAALAARITSLLEASSGEQPTVYAPLALGHHVDHLLLRQAVRKAGLNPVWYEDFPYLGSEPSLSSGHAPAALRRVARVVGGRCLGLCPHLVPFDPAERVRAMRAYQSQLGSVFGSDEKMVGDVERLFLRTADGRPAERLWHPVGA